MYFTHFSHKNIYFQKVPLTLSDCQSEAMTVVNKGTYCYLIKGHTCPTMITEREGSEGTRRYNCLHNRNIHNTDKIFFWGFK